MSKIKKDTHFLVRMVSYFSKNCTYAFILCECAGQGKLATYAGAKIRGQYSGVGSLFPLWILRTEFWSLGLIPLEITHWPCSPIHKTLSGYPFTFFDEPFLLNTSYRHLQIGMVFVGHSTIHLYVCHQISSLSPHCHCLCLICFNACLHKMTRLCKKHKFMFTPFWMTDV